MPKEKYLFKIASEDWEFEEIHKLNYATFVEEIPQHENNQKKKRIDPYHAENTYFICLAGKKLLGMVAFRVQRPFSLDTKIDNLDSYLPPGRSLCETRLLAVDRSHRHSRIAQKLIAMLVNHAIKLGYDTTVISATVRQLKLYKHLGFVPFGPRVGSEDARYQPMYLTVEKYKELKKRSRAFSSNDIESERDGTELFNFLPGPVEFSRGVKQACQKPPRSHRGNPFMEDFQKTRKMLCKLVNAAQVEIMMASGTAANDAVAGQISLLKGKGLILVSGEFGRRLTNHARGAGLAFETLKIAEGETFLRSQIETQLERESHNWIWSVHCETSTGVLHDLDMLKEISAKHGLKLCLDATSSIGTVPLDLKEVYLASAVSGKGLASMAGISMIFHDHNLHPQPDNLPRCLDLGYYQAKEGIPFTIQSNLLDALSAALRNQNWEKRYKDIKEWHNNMRLRIGRLGAELLAPEEIAAPAVITIVLPEKISSLELGTALEEAGVLTSFRSSYLLQRNWLQVCMMGGERNPVDKFLKVMEMILP